MNMIHLINRTSVILSVFHHPAWLVSVCLFVAESAKPDMFVYLYLFAERNFYINFDRLEVLGKIFRACLNSIYAFSVIELVLCSGHDVMYSLRYFKT